jgi:hypothetical protein
MSRRSPTGFVFSVAAEVIAVVFIVSVLPRVDLRRSAGAAPSTPTMNPAMREPNEPLALPSWGQTVDARPNPPPRETSYYERRPQAVDVPREFSRERDITPLIAVDPAKPGYVEERLDRASQELVNSVGSYVSQAATDLLQVQPPPAGPQRIGQPVPPDASPVPRYSSAITPLAPSFPATAQSAAAQASGSFPTQSAVPTKTPVQPRPWMRY